jgi:hypothetical protein
MYSNNGSGEKGVYWHKACQRWYAYIRINRVQHTLGSFVNFEDAVAARRRSKAALDAVLYAINPYKQDTP